MTTLANVEGFFGTIWFVGLVFVAGSFIGRPLWDWVSKKFPWNQ